MRQEKKRIIDKYSVTTICNLYHNNYFDKISTKIKKKLCKKQNCYRLENFAVCADDVKTNLIKKNAYSFQQ